MDRPVPTDLPDPQKLIANPTRAVNSTIRARRILRAQNGRDERKRKDDEKRRRDVWPRGRDRAAGGCKLGAESEELLDQLGSVACWTVFHKYVVSGFSRTVSGPPEGGHYVQMKTAVVAGRVVNESTPRASTSLWSSWRLTAEVPGVIGAAAADVVRGRRIRTQWPRSISDPSRHMGGQNRLRFGA